MNIYIVMGTAGEYSDRRDWPVCAFEELEKCKKYVIDCQKRAAEIYQKVQDHSWCSYNENIFSKVVE